MSELQNAVNNTIDYIENLEQQIAELNRRDDKHTNLLLQICKSINPEATICNVNEIVGSDEATVRFLDIVQQHNFKGETAETWYNRYGDTKAKLTVLRNDLDTLVNKLNNHETIMYKDFGESKRVKLLLEAMTDYNEASDRTPQALTETNAHYKDYLVSIARAAYNDDTITVDTFDDSESYINDLIYDIGEYSTFFKHHRHETVEDTEPQRFCCTSTSALVRSFADECVNEDVRYYRSEITRIRAELHEGQPLSEPKENLREARFVQLLQEAINEYNKADETDTVGTGDEVIVLRNYLKRIFEAAYPYLQINNDNPIFSDSDIDNLVEKITKNKQAACELVSQKAKDLVTEETRKEQKDDFEILSTALEQQNTRINSIESELKHLKAVLAKLRYIVRKEASNE